MHPAEFEEKDFEGPLKVELLLGSHRCATPGQVFENAFGIDAALEAQHPIFFELFGYRDIPAGIVLPDYRWGWVWRRYGETRTLPSFPVNVLIQAKRPDRLEGRRADFAALGIDRHYWRFFITDHQQVLLERLEHQLRGRALVVYASPAFDTLDDLYRLTENQLLVENTSFVRPSRLAAHSSWNYNSAGTSGIAASKPKPIKDEGFLSGIDFLIKASKKTDAMEDLKFMDGAISETMQQHADNPVVSFFRKSEQRFADSFPRYQEIRKEVVLFTRIQRFLSLLHVSWMVYGKENG